MKNRKKFAALFLAAALVAACAGCGEDAGSGESGSVNTEESSSSEENSEESSEAPEESSEESSEAPEESSEEGSEGSEAGSGEGGTAGIDASVVMSYEEYAAAALDTEVVVETYVQAKQSWWENKATLYTQDENGAYFIYELPCTEEEYAQMTPGTKIRVKGFKSEWSGEVEITDAAFEFVEGGDSFVAEPKDVTTYLGQDELADFQNQFVAFKGMTVEPVDPEDENCTDAFWYRDNNSGQDGDDLYFRVSLDGTTYLFTVESYLCDNTTDVYAAVKNLKVGDKIDMEGFLYWYNGANPHITSVTAAE